jgi:hypothetical protein
VFYIRVGFDVMYDDGWVDTWYLFITLGENISKLLKEGGVGRHLFRVAILTDVPILAKY